MNVGRLNNLEVWICFFASCILSLSSTQACSTHGIQSRLGTKMWGVRPCTSQTKCDNAFWIPRETTPTISSWSQLWSHRIWSSTRRFTACLVRLKGCKAWYDGTIRSYGDTESGVEMCRVYPMIWKLIYTINLYKAIRRFPMFHKIVCIYICSNWFMYCWINRN